MSDAVHLLKCPCCGADLIFEEQMAVCHLVSADGEYLLSSGLFGTTTRKVEWLGCKHCGADIQWDKSPDGRIFLLPPRKKKGKEN